MPGADWLELMRVSIDGGTPTTVGHDYVASIDVSPDGRSLALVSQDRERRFFIVVCDLPKCAPRRVLAVTALGAKWTPDGSRIAFVPADKPDNLWTMSVAGEPPRQMTAFTDGRRIDDFAWSRRDRRLAVLRSTTTNDIVTFRGLSRRE